MLHVVRTSNKAFPLFYGLLALIVVLEAFLTDWYWVIMLTGWMLVLPLVMWWTMWKQVRGVVKAWQPLETEFGPEMLVIRTTVASSELPLSSIKAVREVGDFVAVQLDHTRVHNLLPREAFPAHEVEVIRGRVALRGEPMAPGVEHSGTLTG